MASFEELQEVESAMRELVERAGLPEPDEVEYDPDSILLLWHEHKLAVVVDVNDPPASTGGPRQSSSP
jgi:hypothetical protein